MTMSRAFLIGLLFATVTVLCMAHARPEAEAAKEGEEQLHRKKREDGGRGDYPLDDADLMQRIFRAPMKRQWCRSGESYNPVLGTCTLSLAAMRGRARTFRGA